MIDTLDIFSSLNALEELSSTHLQRNPSYYKLFSQLSSCNEAVTFSWVLCKFCGIHFMKK